MQIFLTEKEVAKQINVSLATLRRWRLEQARTAIREGWCIGEISPGRPGAMDGGAADRWDCATTGQCSSDRRLRMTVTKPPRRASIGDRPRARETQRASYPMKGAK